MGLFASWECGSVGEIAYVTWQVLGVNLDFLNNKFLSEDVSVVFQVSVMFKYLHCFYTNRVKPKM